MSTKFDIEKFDGKISFAIWRVQMLAVLTQNGLKKVLSGKSAKPATTTEEQWEETDEKALSTIQLCLSREVLREVINEKTAAGIWSKLESLYMTKSLANKLRLKERLFTLRMSEGTPIQSHLGEFNSIIIDLENLDVEIDDEDKAVLLIVSLPPSYRHFKEIMLYGNNVTLSFDDVKSNLLSKEKFDTQIHSESSGEGLVVRGRNHEVGASGKNQSKSKGKNSKYCRYCKKRNHEISECYKLKNKQNREDKGKQPEKSAEASFVETESDGECFIASGTEQRSKNEWVLDSGCTFHMSPNRDWFTTYESFNGGLVLMGNDAQCKVVGKGTIKIKTHDGVVRTLTSVRHVPDLKRNLISLGTLESQGCRYSAEGGVLKVSKGALVLLKAIRSGSLYLLQGSPDIGLVFDRQKSDPGGVVGYVDADYSGDLDRRRSLSAYIFKLCGSAISWYLSLQAIAALSTTEAEYIVVTEGVKEAIWLRGLVAELGLQQQILVMFCDREITVEKIHTTENPADMLTKPLPAAKFDHCLDLAAKIPFYLYPFLDTTSESRPFEYLRLTSLGVIGALVKADDTQVIRVLLPTRIIQRCLRAMQIGSELSKTVATFILRRCLLDDVGLRYICTTPELVFAVVQVLGNMVGALAAQPSSSLLKHIIRCYLRLSNNPRACDVVRILPPDILRDTTFSSRLSEDRVTKKWLQQLLHNVDGNRRI
ncbi:hypothetical protein CQW23_08136 [Capsicum baccatum]|uniref:Retrovirus-related Pol polyprotein from transposon TNT 1-94-like beta-barrel domain-containing protein n=1 Tax=Capsicum baccatum TaxID=33114 RepID=A0A2G2X831_CAPBA|nr:hypothetical protein CQW23_08136 [Capsicum baccatum]